jgi:hypothetical protein
MSEIKPESQRLAETTAAPAPEAQRNLGSILAGDVNTVLTGVTTGVLTGVATAKAVMRINKSDKDGNSGAPSADPPKS